MRVKEYVLYEDSGQVTLRSYHSVLSPQLRAYREHHHTECELSLFLSGRGTYAVHGKEYDFCTGDVFLFGSNEAHSITRIDEPMDLLNVHFEPRVLWERTESAELLNLFAARSKGFCHRFADTDGTLAQKILHLEGELSEPRPCRALEAKCALFSALTHMIRQYDCVDPQKSVAAPSSLTQSLHAAIQYIHKHLSDKLTLEQIADSAAVSTRECLRCFRDAIHQSPIEYLLSYRIGAAKKLLETTGYSITETALRTGFNSAAYFSQQFKLHTGKTPNAYRREVQEKQL